MPSTQFPNACSPEAARTKLAVGYHILRDGNVHNDLSTNYFDERDKTEVAERTTMRSEPLGPISITPHFSQQ